MSDDPSVLGNLPRSRPGRRSSKRDGAKAAAAKPGAAKPKPKPKRGASAKPRGQARPARAQARSVAKEPPPTQRPASPGDPMTGAIRLAGQVAGVGFKVAGEILKRVPRP